MDINSLYINSLQGIQFDNPLSVSRIIICDNYERITWAEKQRDKLLNKLKNRIALRNRILLWVLTIISAVFILFIVVFCGAYLLQRLNVYSEIIGLELGWIGCMLCIIPWYFWDNIIETNPLFIHPKRYDYHKKHGNK